MQEPPINAELFVQLAEGNELAFRHVFHYFTPRLQPFVYSIVKSPVVAEEIVQEVFLKLWANRVDVSQKDNPPSWLFTVAAHQSLSFLRRMAVERRYIDDIKLRIQQNWDENPTEDQLSLKENESLLKNAINLLPPQQKLIYTLSRHDGLSHKEIADQLNISPNTVKNHVVAAGKTLREFIRDAGFNLFVFFFISY